MKPLISREDLIAWLYYDADNGILTWKKVLGSRCKIGDEAGYETWQGYREIQLRGRVYRAHRVAWCLFYGEWPQAEIDHINGVRNDNRILNLRSATKSENQHNRKAWSKVTSSKFKGVSWHKVSGKWMASIQSNRQRTHLGLFATEDGAHAAYKKAAIELHGEFARAV